MRRIVPLLLVVVAVAVAVALAGRGHDTYRFRAVFDTARGMVPGQLVKVAGTKVGEVVAVDLTDEQKARMTLEIEARFAPLRDDARCRILPEGLVSENYVECDPGTPGRPSLADPDGTDLPIVSLERTEVAVQLQQVIDTFSLPVSERIRVILTELGTATVGRGDDLNALLRRANPALGQAREVLGALRGQRREIRDAIAQTDEVLVELRSRKDDVRRFVDRTATVAQTTAGRRTALRRSVQELPPMLAEADGALGDLDTAARALTPTARRLRASGPMLAAVNDAIPRFATPALPALDDLARAARRGRSATGPTESVVARLAEFARSAAGPARAARELLVSLRDTGGIDSIYDFIYGFANLTAGYDAVSHQVNFAVKTAPQCLLDAKALGCDHGYGSPGRGRVPINDTTQPPDLPGKAGTRAVHPTGGGQRADRPGRDKDGKVPLSALPEDTRRDLVDVIDRLLR
ncbi:MAG: MlaD family protein [Solirubrobacteraceae bacterium]